MLEKRKNKRSRYKHIDGKRLIEISIKSPSQLFDARDPAPFRERDLDDDLLEYIVSSAQEISARVPIKILIYVGEKESSHFPAKSIEGAIRDFLSYQIDLKRTAFRVFLRRAQMYLVLGLIVLFVSIWSAQKLRQYEMPDPLAIVREGLVIIGWVSMWRPIELVLYDWLPMYEVFSLYKRLKETEIEIKFAEESVKKI